MALHKSGMYNTRESLQGHFFSQLILSILLILFLAETVAGAAPVALFSGTPLTGVVPLTISFTDASTNTPTGWVWFFGDETYTQAWRQINASSGFSKRAFHTGVTMPNGSIVLMGGSDNSIRMNDTWKSTDNGATWTQMNASAGWLARYGHTSLAMPDGSIILMGGRDTLIMNDTWRSTDNGAIWTQINASSGWTNRFYHSGVAMPDGSIILMGGSDGSNLMNDTWRSTDNGALWTQISANAGWTARYGHTSLAMPDGSIILMGGSDDTNIKNDVWRSTDNGAIWTQINASPGWPVRLYHTSLTMPDESIVLMGGYDGSTLMNDTWKSTDNGAIWTQTNTSAGWTARYGQNGVTIPNGNIVLTGGLDTVYKNETWSFSPVGETAKNPSHTYTAAGTYSVTLQVYNADGYNSLTKTGYITITDSVPVTNPIITTGGYNDDIGIGAASDLKTGEVTFLVLRKTAVTEVAILPAEDIPELMITVERKLSPERGIDSLDLEIYQYDRVTLYNAGASEITNITYTFEIPNDWLLEKNLQPALWFYNEKTENWTRYSADITGDNGGVVISKATCPVTGWIALGGEAIILPETEEIKDYPKDVPVRSYESEMVNVSMVADSEVTMAAIDEQQNETAGALLAAPAQELPVIWIAGIFGTGLLGVTFVYVKRWYRIRQNPSLFRKYD